MRIQLTQSSLSAAIATVSPSVGKRSTLPVLKCILLMVSDGRLTLSATDLQTYIQRNVQAKVDGECGVCIDAAMLANTINALDDGMVTLDVDTEKATLTVTAGRNHANIKGMSMNEFPIAPDVEGEPLTCLYDTFQAAIDLVAFAATSDVARPVLTGVLLEIANDTLTMAAADGYRMSLVTMDAPDRPAGRWLIPAASLRMLAKLDAGEIIMRDDNLHARLIFDTPRVRLATQLIDGTFPNVREIIPSEYNTRVIIDRAELLSAVKLAMVFARDGANVIKLTPGVGGLRVASTSTEYGDNTTMLTCDMDGLGVEIGFNGKYLLDVLSAMHSEQVTLEMHTPHDPGVLRMVGDDSFTHAIMPMAIAK